MQLESEDDHIKVHREAARYHAVVLLFHLRKMESPYCDAALPSVGILGRETKLEPQDVETFKSQIDNLLDE